MADTVIRQAPSLPRAVLIAAAGLIVFATAAALGARLAGIGASRLEVPPMIEDRLLVFTDGPDGRIEVRDAGSRAVLGSIEAGQYGFVKVVLRGFARDRALHEVGAEHPFKLGRTAEGQMLIQDTATGRVLVLGAFGAGNAEAFYHVFQLGRSKP
jgi:putative photosynthetic complex assembly protein